MWTPYAYPKESPYAVIGRLLAGVTLGSALVQAVLAREWVLACTIWIAIVAFALLLIGHAKNMMQLVDYMLSTLEASLKEEIK